MLMRNVP